MMPNSEYSDLSSDSLPSKDNTPLTSSSAHTLLSNQSSLPSRSIDVAKSNPSHRLVPSPRASSLVQYRDINHRDEQQSAATHTDEYDDKDAIEQGLSSDAFRKDGTANDDATMHSIAIIAAVASPSAVSPACAIPSPSSNSSFWLIFSLLSLVLILSESSRGIVIPTLSLYTSSLGGSTAFLGVLVAMFSMGRLASAFAYARYLRWSAYASSLTHQPSATANVHILSGLLASLIIVLSGHILYILAASFTSTNSGLSSLVFARLLVGFGTGTLVLARTFVAERVPEPARRNRFMAALGIEQFVGFAFTPGLGAIDVNGYIGKMHFTQYNFGSYLLAILTIVAIAGLAYTRTKLVRENYHNELEAAVSESVQSVSIVPFDPSSDINSLVVESSPSPDPRLYSIDRTRAAESRRSNADVGGDVELTFASNASPQPATAAMSPVMSGRPVELLCQNEYHLSISLSSRPRAPSSSPPPSQRRPGHPAIAMSPNGLALGLGLDTPLMLDDEPHDALDEYENRGGGYVSPLPIHPSSLSLAINPSPLHASSTPRFASSSSPAQHRHRLPTPALLILLVLANVFVRGSLSIAETYGSLIYYTVIGRGDADQVSDNSLFFLALGMGGVASFLLVEHLVRCFTSRWCLLAAFASAIIGYMLLVDFDGDLHRKRFTLGMLLVWSVASPISQTIIATELVAGVVRMQARKVWDEHSQNFIPGPADKNRPSQATWMGYLTAGGSIGRIIFPLVGGVLYSPGDSGGVMMLCTVAHIVVGIAYVMLERKVMITDVNAMVVWMRAKIEMAHSRWCNRNRTPTLSPSPLSLTTLSSTSSSSSSSTTTSSSAPDWPASMPVPSSSLPAPSSSSSSSASFGSPTWYS